MHFVAVLNEDGGTLRGIDLDAFEARMSETLVAAGHTIDTNRVAGSEIVRTLKKIASSPKADIVLAGGGDGTISAAAAALQNKRKALAVLPAGTMNLFARGLGLPLDLDAATRVFAKGNIRAVDMARATGRPFIHQFSVGMHAKLVDLRERMEFGSRFGKIGASARAAYLTIANPPTLKVSLRIDKAELQTRTTAIGITNNLFGEGHLPYADAPDGGTLGVYVTIARQKGELFEFFFNMARGRWRENAQVQIHEAQEVELKILSSRSKYQAVLDGELVPLDAKTTISIHPKSLNVLVP